MDPYGDKNSLTLHEQAPAEDVSPYQGGTTSYPSAPPDYTSHPSAPPDYTYGPQSYPGTQSSINTTQVPFPSPPCVTTAPLATPVIIRQGPIMPNSHTAFAILVCLFMCWPFGLVAIIKGNQVRDHYRIGDFAGAESASRAALSWSYAGLFTGIVIYVCVFIALLVPGY